ncbi:MAG: hypothetical protein IJ295_00330 [Clostridia bacterium]|nr:hypothetical protein [Clostridia bacterium]
MHFGKKLTTFKVAISKSKELKKPVLSPEEREESIQHLVNLFRLTFRTDYDYMETIRDSEDAEGYFDDVCTVGYSVSARSGSDEEMEEYRAKFKALDAEAKFIECCIDYYKDVNTELKYSCNMLMSKLKLLKKELGEVLPSDKEKKRWIRNRHQTLEERLDLTLTKKAEVGKILNELYRSLQLLKGNNQQNESIK